MNYHHTYSADEVVTMARFVGVKDRHIERMIEAMALIDTLPRQA